jgi:hypothetical protein
MMILAFAVLVGWGWKVAEDRWSEKLGKRRWFAATALVSAVMLLEYLSVPIATLPVRISPFIYELGQDPEEYAVIDVPLGRQFGRYYMFQQIYHGKRLIEGVVSRTPADAYAFIQGDDFWARLAENGDIDVTLRDVSRHLDFLARNNTRYVIVHRDDLSKDQLARWRDYFTVDPLYEDSLIIVYSTAPKAGRDFELTSELGAGLGLIRVSVSPVEITQGDNLYIDFRWGSRAAPDRDVHVCLRLVNRAGEISSDKCWEPVEGWPTSEWPAGAVGIGEYLFPVDPQLPVGEYTLVARLLDPATRQRVGDSVALEEILVKEAAPQYRLSTPFGRDLRLLEYGITQDTEALRLALTWRAERRMNVDYKIFVHVRDLESGDRVAQADLMPRNWTYPTTLWEAGEVVSDEIVLPMEGVPGGRYEVVLGVYHPQTGERLPVGDVQGVTGTSDFLRLQEVTIP